MTYSNTTPTLDTLEEILENSRIGDKHLEAEFNYKKVVAELIIEAKETISWEPDFQWEMHPNIEADTERQFIKKAHAIIDAAADEATDYAINKTPLYYELSPIAILNLPSFTQSWNERLEDELANA